MHRAIAAWLNERSWHAGVATAVCGVMAPQMPLPFLILAGAIPAFVVLSKDARLGLILGAIGSIAVAAAILPMAEPARLKLAGCVAIIFSATLLASLWRRTRSPNLSFQVAVLGMALALVLVYVGLPGPDAFWVKRLTRLMKTMTEAGLTAQRDDVDALVQVWARTMWGALAAMMLTAILLSLFLGRWWLTLLRNPGEFGAEFRQLRLGKVLGIVVTILFIMALSLQMPLVDSLAWVGFAGLTFQGLAAAHRSKASGRLNRGWLAAIYVLLLMPLSTSVTLFVLAIWGFVDNWLRPRALVS